MAKKICHYYCALFVEDHSPFKVTEVSWLTSGRPSLLRWRETIGVLPRKSFVVAVKSSPSIEKHVQNWGIRVTRTKYKVQHFWGKCWCLLGNCHVALSPRQSTNSATIGSLSISPTEMAVFLWYGLNGQQPFASLYFLGTLAMVRVSVSWENERERDRHIEKGGEGRNYRTIRGKKREGSLKVCYRFHYHINTLSIQIWCKGEEQKALGESRRSAESYHIGIMRVVCKCSTGIQVGGINGLQHSQSWDSLSEKNKYIGRYRRCESGSHGFL